MGLKFLYKFENLVYFLAGGIAELPVISSQNDFIAVILSLSDYEADGILNTEKKEYASLLTVLHYCIKIKALTENSSH